LENNLVQYLKLFQNLRIDKSHGIAPHKPILLICVLQTIQSGLQKDHRIYITPELVSLYKTNWTLLVTTTHDCRFALPFYHLSSSKFWKLKPKPGYENIIKIKSGMRSLLSLNAAVDFAYIDNDLFSLMKDKVSNETLLQFLLNNYFPDTKTNFCNSTNEQKYIHVEIENKILTESSAVYQQEIKNLLEQNDEEEIFIRGGLFKREIPKIYNNTCCISGMRIDATINVSMIDACHIIPFSESYDDTVTNGIALCPNLHRAFDRGLIAIDENYKVVVSNSFREDETNYGIRAFEGVKINLPNKESYFPTTNNFLWHLKNIFKK